MKQKKIDQNQDFHQKKKLKDGLTTLVGDEVEEIILKNKKQDVFLEFYSDDCDHCLHFQPTFEQVAYAFANDQNIVIAKMNADRNWRKGLLTLQQYTGTPTLKLFHAGHEPEEKLNLSKEAAIPSYKMLIEWIFENRKSSWTEKDKAEVLKRADEYEPQTREKLSKIIDEDKESDDALHLHSRAPCGDIFFNLLKHNKLKKHGLKNDCPEIGKKFQECADLKSKETNDYWKDIVRIAKDALPDERDEKHEHSSSEQQQQQQQQQQSKEKEQAKSQQKQMEKTPTPTPSNQKKTV